MTTAIIGTGALGSVIARRLALGGEALRLSSADSGSARKLAAEIGQAAVVALDNADALRGADAVVLALRFSVLKGVMDEIAVRLSDKVVVVPSNPVGLDAQGTSHVCYRTGSRLARLWPGGCRPGRTWPWRLGPCRPVFESSSNQSPEPAVLFYATDDDRAGEEVERLVRTAGFEPVRVGGIEQSGRLEVGGDLHDLVVGTAEARSLIGGA